MMRLIIYDSERFEAKGIADRLILFVNVLHDCASDD